MYKEDVENTYTKKDFDELLADGDFTIISVSGEYYTIRVKYDFSIFWLIIFGIFYVIYYFVNRQSTVLTVKITEDKKDESNN